MDSSIANPPLRNIDLLFWAAIRNEDIGREADSMASPNLLPSSSVAPITQPDYLGPTTHPAIELRPSRQKRRLEYVKCDFCRRSKKKCEPSERQWPGEKCQRCIEKGFTCSAPTKKNGDVPDALSMVNNSSLESSEQGFLHEQRAYCALAEKCIQRMCYGLKRNICKLASANTAVRTIRRSHIDYLLPEELQYACRFWISHLYRGKDRFLADVDLQDQVYSFLKGYFLCWLEALSLLQLVYDGIDSLETLERLVNDMQTTGMASIRRFIHDAKRFILDYAEHIEHSPLNIYPNALRCIRSGSMENTNIPKLQPWNGLRCGEVCGTLTTIFEGHTTGINDIGFSPDGKLLATASVDGTVKLWDPATRKTLQVLRHNSRVESIAFSRDGNFLACAVTNVKNDAHGYSWTINLWDPATGKELEVRNPMEAVGMACSIAFSPDGKLLALACSFDNYNGTVCLFNPLTGHSLQTFHRCSESQSIAFSPDGKLLASSWADGVVKIWDPHTGYEMKTFEGVGIPNIAFSPDGQLLAFSSHDEVKIWDPVTGIKRQTLLATDNMYSIAFSPDGKLLAAALLNNTVEFWEPTTGRRQGDLVGHSGSVAPITFSSDGNMLAWVTDTSLLPARNSPCIGEVELWELYIIE